MFQVATTNPVSGLAVHQVKQCPVCGWLGHSQAKHWSIHHTAVVGPRPAGRNVVAQRFNSAFPYFLVKIVPEIIKDLSDQVPDVLKEAIDLINSSNRPKQSTDARDQSAWVYTARWHLKLGEAEPKEVARLVEPATSREFDGLRAATQGYLRMTSTSVMTLSIMHRRRLLTTSQLTP
jgi:hypothetical protein